MSANQISGLPKNESLFRQMISKYLPYWPLFVVFLIIGGALAYTYLRYATPKYEATATLLVKDEKKGYDDSKFVESFNMISTKKIIENEIEVLQSRTLMDSVVRKLHLYAPIAQEGKIRPRPVYKESPVFIEAANPDSIKNVKKVLIKINNSYTSVTLNNNLTYAVNEWVYTPYGILKFTPNPAVFVDNATDKPYYFSLLSPKETVENILHTLKVSASNKLSSVIELSYRDPVPKRAEDILNYLIQAYRNAAINEKNTLAKNTLAFIDDRLSLVGKDLDNIQQNIQSYKSGSGAVDISTQGQLYLQNVSANDQKMSDLNMQAAVLDQLDKMVSSDRGGVILPSTLGVNDPALVLLITNLNNAQADYDKLRRTVAENNPMLVSITDQIKRIKGDIIENVKAQKNSIQTAKEKLAGTNNQYNAALTTIPQKERQLLEISRNQNIQNGIYQFLLQKREETKLSLAAIISDSRVVNYAEAGTDPVSPNKIIIYLAALAFAFGVPIVFISLKEGFNKKILFRDEITALTSMQIIGEIFYEKTKAPFVIESGKKSIISEQIRKIRAALPFLGISEKNKKILITSSISGEGKSFVAANLAAGISLTGQKVILLDFDLHNPGLSRALEKTDEAGVSDYLKGEKEPEEVIRRVSGYENLFFIPAGNLPDNPSELVVNEKTKDLIQYVENIFDVVVIDSPPVFLATDAYILSNYCNATLYVVRHKYTPKMLLKRIDENCRINPLNNAAIVFNGVKSRGFFKNNYEYGYGYGNDYVYTYNQPKQKSKK
ncbi:MAG: polysaccharide biosynthesis tyrosine autokinase [Bacteroidota bacterium]|jgi:capsular exopolysaccharide synthesis family protein|nr:polysaccharide biosynthesis tyrosine autokinase [Bacteroidota bacterium]